MIKLENDKFPYFVSALIVGKDMRKEDVKLDAEIPMMTYKDAYISKDFSRLVGKFVRIEIGKDTFTIKKGERKQENIMITNKYYECFISGIKIAFLSFGGGASAIPFMKKEYLENRKWISEEEFSDMVILSNLLPGPTISQIVLLISKKSWI